MSGYSYVLKNCECKEKKWKKKLPACEGTIIHKEVVEEIKTKIPEEEVLYELGDFFKLLGDSTRIKILSALFHSEMCVCDIASLFDMTQSAISHQLRVLKQGRLVKYRKSGKVVYYSLDDEHVKEIVEQGLNHITEKK